MCGGGGGLVAKLCPTHCDPMNCSPPGSSVHGIFQAKILEWVDVSPPGDLPNPGIELESLVSPILKVDSLPTEPPRKPLYSAACLLSCQDLTQVS